jgi:hypothetical protein
MHATKAANHKAAMLPLIRAIPSFQTAGRNDRRCIAWDVSTVSTDVGFSGELRRSSMRQSRLSTRMSERMHIHLKRSCRSKTSQLLVIFFAYYSAFVPA